MPLPHPATADVDELLRACDVQRSRAGGPGGQHRNKVETAVEIRHRPTGVTGAASERRSQAQNRAMALFRLRVNLALQVRTPFVGPSDLWRRRCGGTSWRVNPAHADFPSLLAEALDAVVAAAYAVPEAAAALGCTTSQLVRFLRVEPRALAGVNAQRQARDMRPLR